MEGDLPLTTKLDIDKMYKSKMTSEATLELFGVVKEQVYQMQPSSNSFPKDFVDDYYKNRNLDSDWEDFVDKIWLCDKISPKILQGCCFETQDKINVPTNWFPLNMHELALKKTPCGHPHITEHKKIARAFIEHIDRNNLI